MSDLLLQYLPYHRDSGDMLRRIAALPGAACLDSGLGDQAEGRYDILTSLPTRQLRSVPAGSNIEYRHYDDLTWHPLTAETCIFSAAEALLLQGPPDPQTAAELSHLPFCGGVIACFGYESASDRPPLTDDRHELMAILRQTPVANCGLYQWAVVVDHVRATTTLFVLPECPVSIRQQVVALVLEPTLSAEIKGRAATAQGFSLHSAFSPQLSRSQYEAAFDRLKAYIEAGDCYQANLAIPFVARYQGDPLSAYLRLRQGSHSPFSAFYDSGDHQVLSLSPERFVSVQDRQVITQPIKGTRKRSADPVEDRQRSDDLLSSEKDRAENLMIVDLLRNDLGTVCETGSVRTRDLFKLHSFSQVHHLISTITGTLPAHVSPFALLRRCFPGGSITGAPKIRAMEIIAELEPLPRAVYCGSVAYVDYRGNMDSNISIRTLLCRQGHIFCWGGGGIVADSVMAHEYQEAYDKVSALLDLVSMLSVLQG